jgi:hypothetical protein
MVSEPGDPSPGARGLSFLLKFAQRMMTDENRVSVTPSAIQEKPRLLANRMMLCNTALATGWTAARA